VNRSSLAHKPIKITACKRSIFVPHSRSSQIVENIKTPAMSLSDTILPSQANEQNSIKLVFLKVRGLAVF
jgi:hypothetical protein